MEYIKISDFAEVITGGTPSTERKEYWENGNIPWLQSGCCQNCFVTEASNYITKLGYENSVTKMMPKDTVLIALTGATAGKVGYLLFDACGNQSITGILPNKTIDSKFMYYFLQYKRYQIVGDCVGGAQPHISQGYVKNILVPKYDSKSQKEIVKYLDELTNTINKDKEELIKLDELVKSRFIEMFGNYTADKTIGELTSICRGASPRPISNFITNGDGENWIKIGDVGENDIYITHTAEKVTKAGADKSRRVKPGDFILSNSMSFGRPYILGINGCVHDGWLIISDYQNTFEPLFFYHLLRSPDVQAQFDGSANGACVRNLNSDLVKKVKVMTPPMDAQKEFVAFANQIDKSKFNIQKRINLYQELLDKKMSQYFD